MYKKLLSIFIIGVIIIFIAACNNSVNNEQKKDEKEDYNSQNILNVSDDDFLNYYVYKDDEERVHLTTEEQSGITKLVETGTSLCSVMGTSVEEYIVDDLLIIDKADKMFSGYGLHVISGIENIITKSTKYMFDHNNVPPNINKLNTRYITDMSYMFYSSQIETLKIGKWDTSNVTDMSYMFAECRELKELSINNWNTSNVMNLEGMFY